MFGKIYKEKALGFWCNVVSGRLELKEHAAVRWLSKEELFDVEWLPADIELMKKIRKIM